MATAQRITIAPHDAAPATWAPCPICWGQRQILVREQALNGEGAVLRPASCETCLGLGEVLAA